MDAGATSVRSLNELLALSQKIPAQANAALNGDAAALDELSKSRARYSSSRTSLGGDVQSFDGSTEMLKQSQVILSSSEAIEGVHKAARRSARADAAAAAEPRQRRAARSARRASMA